MTDLDHRDSDLRGRSFRHQLLDQADFSGADLRGVDFSRARLRNANFSGAKLGMTTSVAGWVFFASLLIVAATGFVIGSTLRDLSDGLTSATWEDVFGRALALGVIGFFMLCAVAFGLRRALKYGAVGFVVGLGSNYAVIAMTSRNFDFGRDGRVIGAVALLAAAMVAGGIARVVGGTYSTWAVVIVGLVGGYAAGRGGGGVAGIVVSTLLVVLAKRTLRNDERDTFARRFVHRVVSRRGSRFTHADLSGADFAGTQLAQCDLTGTNLDGTHLDNTQGWPAFIARPSGTMP